MISKVIQVMSTMVDNIKTLRKFLPLKMKSLVQHAISDLHLGKSVRAAPPPPIRLECHFHSCDPRTISEIISCHRFFFNLMKLPLTNYATGTGTPPDETLSGIREELTACERTISENLDSAEKRILVAEALSAIHERKLYHGVGIKTFAIYVRTRWGLSRPRAYQLIDFVRTRRAAIVAGKSPPTNERQSRIGKTGINQSEAFEVLWAPIFRYLNKRFLSFPQTERARLAETLEVVAKSFVCRARKSESKQDKNKN